MYNKKLGHLAFALLAAVACTASLESRAQFDNPLPGLTEEELEYFEQGRAVFVHEFTPQEGLGPTFNATSCVTCHFLGGDGGAEDSTTNNVTHYGVDHEGRFLDLFEHGGPVAQVKSLASEDIPGRGQCEVPPDVVPSPHVAPGVITSPRHTPPVFGFGLIDAIPDSEILEYEGKKRWKKPGVRGIANWGVEMESLRGYTGVSVIRPRTQPSGAPRVGRFGWHGFTGTLFQFSSEPFNIELGVTTPFFPREFMPNGQPTLPPECQLDTAPNDTNGQDAIKLYLYQAFLAPPPRGEITRDVRRGERIFKQIGCTDCHRKTMRTVKDYYAIWPDGSAHRVDALSNKKFDVWSDFLVHDMGPEMDDHRYQGRVNGRFWRTTPLWGLRIKTHMLHDGSATTFDEVMHAHGGEGAWSRDAYFALPEEKKALVDAFLDSL